MDWITVSPLIILVLIPLSSSIPHGGGFEDMGPPRPWDGSRRGFRDRDMWPDEARFGDNYWLRVVGRLCRMVTLGDDDEGEGALEGIDAGPGKELIDECDIFHQSDPSVSPRMEMMRLLFQEPDLYDRLQLIMPRY